MCGILGILDTSNNLSEEYFSSVLSRFRHRGPDQSATKRYKNGLLFGHNRLSIQDLSIHGRQPMSSYNRRYHIVYNGEIYNVKDLISTHLAEVSFKSTSDTEVLLALMQKYNDLSFVIKLLRGMFAIAIFDEQENKLYLARDPFGEKPLYYYCVDGKSDFCFSSSLQAVRHLTQQSALNSNAVYDFLAYGYVRGNKSIYESIESLQPGHYLSVDLSSSVTTVTRYHEIAYDTRAPNVRDFSSLVDEIDTQLNSVVRESLIADVEVGTFLSGGVDSSLITAIASRHAGSLNTFSVGFLEKKYDESGHAAAVARHLGVKHTAITATSENCFEILKALPRAYEEPFADSSQVPTMLVSSLAKQHVSVCLTGDGADELFYGYDRYRQFSLLERIRKRIPTVLLPALAQALQTESMIRLFQGRRILGREISRSLFTKTATVLTETSLECRYDKTLQRNYSCATANLNINSWEDPRIFDVHAYLPSDILVKVDRAAMYYSLETRAPFLNPIISNLAFCRQHNDQIHGRYRKDALRLVLSRYLPIDLFERQKAGFSMPIGDWVRAGWKEYVADIYGTNSMLDAYVPKAAQQKILSDVLEGKDDDIYRLWDIFIFKQWEQEYA